MALVALALVFTAAVVVAVVIASGTSSTVANFRTIMTHDVQSAISQVRQFINGNTK